LPAEVGLGGSAYDFFVRLGMTPSDFDHLLETAEDFHSNNGTKPASENSENGHD
jgi:hypothetical protein